MLGRQHLRKTLKKIHRQLLFLRGWYRGVSHATVPERKKWRITDHGYKIFVFSNHENKQDKILFLITCSYTRKSVWRKRNRDSLRPRLQNANLVVAKSLDRRLTIRRTRAVSNSRRIEQCNREYRLIVQVLHGARKIFRSRITKNNFLNSRFRENKIG